jgi:hypothetical protein
MAYVESINSPVFTAPNFLQHQATKELMYLCSIDKEAALVPKKALQKGGHGERIGQGTTLLIPPTPKPK